MLWTQMLVDVLLSTALWVVTSGCHVAVADLQVPLTLHCFIMHLTVLVTSWPASLIGYLIFLYMVLHEWRVHIPTNKCAYFDGFWWAIAFALFMFPCLHWLTGNTWLLTFMIMDTIYYVCGIRYHKLFRDEMWWLDPKSFHELVAPHKCAWLAQLLLSYIAVGVYKYVS